MEPKPKHPGGRPKLADHEKLVQRSIRLSAEHWAKIDAHGPNGLAWLRKLIDKAKPPKSE